MKRIILFVTLVSLILLTACSTSLLDIPDAKTGRIWLPEAWRMEVVDGWIYIKDEMDNIVGVQWDYGDYWNVGPTIYDERIVNPMFENYVWIDVIQTWGGSNGSAVNLSMFDVASEEIEQYFITYFSYTHDRHELSIFMFDVPLETMISISESYVPY